MKVKTFWLILLKVIGIFLVLRGVNVITSSVTTFSVFVARYSAPKDFIWHGFTMLSILAVYFFILYLFVFKTDWLIDKLHLEKGFDDDRIEINTQLPGILSVAIIVIGGIMLIDSLPQLCKQIFTFFQMKSMSNESKTSGLIILHLVKAVLGYLLMTNSKRITTYINKRARLENDDTKE